MEFLESGRLDKLSVDNDQSEALITLLDAVVIRLEGGTDFDLQVLEEPKSSSSKWSHLIISHLKNHTPSCKASFFFFSFFLSFFFCLGSSSRVKEVTETVDITE